MKTMDWTMLTWVGFIMFILIMLAIDLGVFHRKSHVIKMREAILWSILWITLALLFNLGVYFYSEEGRALEFITAYLLEKSLSVDNLFVFITIFGMMNVNPVYQHKVLFWGVLGALVMRSIFIFTGIALVNNFTWIIYIFGGFLIFTGIKMLFDKDKKPDLEKNLVLRIAKRLLPVAPDFHGSNFFVRLKLKTYATPLFICLILIEFSDLIFAVDSIPAVIAISDDPFIVYSSNVFAIMGLRSLYFVLEGMVRYFIYLKYALTAILVFIGVKMCISGFYKLPISYSLVFILSALTLSVIASLITKRHEIHKREQ